MRSATEIPEVVYSGDGETQILRNGPPNASFELRLRGKRAVGGNTNHDPPERVLHQIWTSSASVFDWETPVTGLESRTPGRSDVFSLRGRCRNPNPTSGLQGRGPVTLVRSRLQLCKDGRFPKDSRDLTHSYCYYT